MSKITKSARGRECQIRIPGVCNGDPDTVVFCHLPGGGMGRKQPDLLGAYGCSACHDVVDGRNSKPVFYDMTHMEEHYSLKTYFHEGVFRTQQILLDEGLIKID